MRPKDRRLADELDARLLQFSKQERTLNGIQGAARREAFIEQLVESVRRIKYIFVIREQDLSSLRSDPASDLFDPIKAAILHERAGRIDEAFWLTFLSVHFGKNRRAGWRLVRDVYGALGASAFWNWNRTSLDPKRFRRWLAKNEALLRGGDGVARGFGNHRKYQSLDAHSASGTGEAIESYVNWVGPPRTHQMAVQEAESEVNGDRRKAFDYLYHSMSSVASFGRTAKFDYLTMVGKLHLAAIEPGSTYLHGATGPASGAWLLFGGDKSNLSRSDLDMWLTRLDYYLHLDFGMQVLEDALCNWQKSPEEFRPFRG